MIPTPNSVISGACPGRMPRYPSKPGIWASSAASFTTSFSGVTISSWKDSGMLVLLTIRPEDIHFFQFVLMLTDKLDVYRIDKTWRLLFLIFKRNGHSGG